MALEDLFEEEKSEKTNIIQKCHETYIGNEDSLFKLYLLIGIPLLVFAFLIIYYPIIGLIFSFLLPAITVLINPDYSESVLISTFLYGKASPVEPIGSQIDTIGYMIVSLIVITVIIKSFAEVLNRQHLSAKFNIAYTIFSSSIDIYMLSIGILLINSIYHFSLSYIVNPERIYSLYGLQVDIYTERINSIMYLIISLIIMILSKNVLNILQSRLYPISVKQVLYHKFAKKKIFIPHCLPGKIFIPYDHVFSLFIQNINHHIIDVNITPENTNSEKNWNIISRKSGDKIIYYIEPLRKISEGAVSVYLKEGGKQVKIRDFEVNATGPSDINIVISAVKTDIKEEEEIPIIDGEEKQVPVVTSISEIINDVLSRLDIPLDEIDRIKVKASSLDKNKEITNLNIVVGRIIEELGASLSDTIILDVKIILKPPLEVSIAYDKNIITVYTYRSTKIINLLKIASFYIKDLPPVEELDEIIIDGNRITVDEEKRIKDIIPNGNKSITIIIEKRAEENSEE